MSKRIKIDCLCGKIHIDEEMKTKNVFKKQEQEDTNRVLKTRTNDNLDDCTFTMDDLKTKKELNEIGEGYGSPCYAEETPEKIDDFKSVEDLEGLQNFQCYDLGIIYGEKQGQIKERKNVLEAVKLVLNLYPHKHGIELYAEIIEYLKRS